MTLDQYTARIEKLEEENQKAKKELGDVYYEQWNCPNAELLSILETLCTDIKNREEECQQVRRQIEALQSGAPQRARLASDGSFVCPCGQSNIGSAKFCIRCGQPLIIDAPEGMKQCVCGKLVKQGANFCPFCGTALK